MIPQSTSTPLDAQIRPHFPALRRTIDGQPVAYFDGPAGSQVPERVIAAVADYLAYHNANTEGAFASSVETDAILREARASLADFVGARSPHEIVFGTNMTTMTFALSRALGAGWAAGDEIVVTLLDHQANIGPWRQVARERGMTVRSVPFDPDTLALDYDTFESYLGPRTRLVAVGHASNAVGTINDIERVARLAREAGALCFVDAVHSAPHCVIDVEAIGCDFLACSAYKFFGPHVGVLWGRHEHLERLSPIKLPPSPDTAPERWETGTLDHEGIAGAAAAVEWIASLAPPEAAGDRREAVIRGMQAIERHESALFDRLLSGLGEIPEVRIHGPPAGSPRTPTAGFTLGDQDSGAVAERLARQGIFVWSGDFYASTVVEGLGLEERGGLVRVGLAPYNTEDEVERLVRAVGERTSGITI